jgi:hypothetical protein
VRTDCSDLVLLCTTTWLLNRSFGGLIGLMVLSRYSSSEYLTFRSLIKVSVSSLERIVRWFGMRLPYLSMKGTASSLTKVHL